MHGACPRQTRVRPACVRWRLADFVMRFWYTLAKIGRGQAVCYKITHCPIKAAKLTQF
jgi:hypothetical protein